MVGMSCGCMRRREVFGLFGAAAAWPLEAGAQAKPAPLVGALRMPPPALDLFVGPFQDHMARLGSRGTPRAEPTVIVGRLPARGETTLVGLSSRRGPAGTRRNTGCRSMPT